MQQSQRPQMHTGVEWVPSTTSWTWWWKQRTLNSSQRLDSSEESSNPRSNS
jgi:hypothetical protein